MRIEAEKNAPPSSLEIFLEEINQFPPLTQKKVDTLYQKFILPGREIEEKKEKGQNSLSPEEKEILEKAQEAKEKIFKHNLSLVVFIAKKALTPVHPLFPDLIQEGSIGLLTAVNKYEPGHGTFANYACWWIYQKIRKERLSQENSFPLSNAHCLKTKKIDDYRWIFLNQFGREPTKEEVSKGTKLSISSIENVRQLEEMKNATSLDKFVGNEKKTSLEELLSSDPSQRPVEEAILEKEPRNITMENVLKFPFLTTREAKLLSLYLAGYNYSQIAKNWGLTRERIRQIKNKAIQKIKKHFRLAS